MQLRFDRAQGSLQNPGDLLIAPVLLIVQGQDGAVPQRQSGQRGCQRLLEAALLQERVRERARVDQR